MKRKYAAYYHPNEQEKKAALDNAYIVFDTNALIDILRLSPSLSEKTINTIEKFKSKIRIPSHVAWEYHRHVIETSAEMFALIENRRKNFTFENIESEITTMLSNGKQGNRFPKDCLKEYISIFKRAFYTVSERLKELEDHYRKSFTNQGIQMRISDLLGDCMMKELSDETIREIEIDGKDRYERQVPPGYKDSSKTDNKYGDLIIWHEILELAKNDDKHIFFVSNDLKEDWLLKPSGKTWGPRIELIKEFISYTKHPDKMLLIYSLDQFLKQVDGDEFNATELAVIYDQILNSSILKQNIMKQLMDFNKSLDSDKQDEPDNGSEYISSNFEKNNTNEEFQDQFPAKSTEKKS